MVMKSRKSNQIAVVGMGCRYPGASDLRQLWENILTRRRQFRRMPDQRLPLADYHDPDRTVPDKTYGAKAAVIDGFEFDWINWRIPKTSFESTDIVHWLTLDVAQRAVEDAGYSREKIPTERTGVILGNTLTGEQTRSQTMRLRWPYVRRVLIESAKTKGLSAGQITDLAETMEIYYKSVFAAVTEDTLAGGLSNTIAGRVCGFFDFHGGGYTVDGACSSSLIAVITAARALVNGDLDLALAGGVDISLDTFELIGFAKTGALSPTDMRVYDRRANGFTPGEGCGFAVLKRLEDARADGDYVYAILNGWGLSSDGKGGITAPSSRGQSMALNRAYEIAPYGAKDLDFVEGHGTGTPVGDREELKGIALAVGDVGEAPLRSCGVTSFKSIVGHTKAAAGIGGFIKAVMAVNQRVLPPSAGCAEPSVIFDKEAKHLYPILQGEVKLSTDTLRAGVSAMGFGGINSHATLESGDSPAERLKSSLDQRALMASNQETELFVLSAASTSKLIERAGRAGRLARGMSEAEMVDLAARLTSELDPDSPIKAAIIADSPSALLDAFGELERMLQDEAPSTGEFAVNPRKNVWLGNGIGTPRVGFLFPGQGSQKINMARKLIERHQWARELVEEASQWLKDEAGLPKFESTPLTDFIYKPLDRALGADQVEEWANFLTKTDVAQPAICLASLLWINYLDRLGIRPSMVGGHSLGELIAFHAAGAYDAKTLIRLAGVRGKAMTASMGATGGATGTMASLACPVEDAEEILKQVGGYAVAANVNSPKQTVISGEEAAVAEAARLAKDKNIQVRALPVSNAFHSKLVAAAADELRANAPVPETLGKTSVKLISGMNGCEVAPGADLKEHFSRQVLSQVDFISLVRAMAEDCDVFVEAGPGRILSGLVKSILNDENACFAVEAKPQSDADLNVFLAAYFTRGGKVNWKELYADRLVRTFAPAEEMVFIENQCEKPFEVPRDKIAANSRRSDQLQGVLSEFVGDSLGLTADYLARRGEFLKAIIKTDLENLPKADRRQKQSNVIKFRRRADDKPLKDEPKLATPMAARSASAGELLFQLVEKRSGFPKESLSPELRLLDDLNLDSIKAAELIAEAATKLGIAGKLDPSEHANASLSTIAELLETLAGPRQISPSPAVEVKPKATTGRPSAWVRDFAVVPVPETMSEQPSESGFIAGGALILSKESERDIAEALSKHLNGKGLQTSVASFSDPAPGDGRFSNFIAVLPRLPNSSKELAERLPAIVERLRAPVLNMSNSSGSTKQNTVAYVQFGGGYFGKNEETADVEQCCAKALAASLHLERPELKVRVLDFHTNASPETLAELVWAELSTAGNYSAVGYDEQFTRRVPRPRLLEPADYRPRKISWSPDDVVLATGGAKGITAECAFALAKETGVRMALAGSSEGAGSSEIAKTLERFKAAGLSANYYQCDVVDAADVERLVQRVRQDMGAVTAVIHGAGLNKPSALDKVSAENALREVSPKLLGAANLCRALENAPPKLFAGFSSIIGVSGMQRNGWYGFSNEALSLVLADFGKKHRETAVVCMAFSIWDEVGMGARMGSNDYLAKLGIDSIPVEEGVGRFLHLVKNDSGEGEVVVTARVGGLDTWRPAEFPKPNASRFLESVVSHFPGVETRVRAHLSLERDPYLKDHFWRGTHLFPTVFGLEAMAQAVAHATGISDFSTLRIEDVGLERPIAVDPERGADIEIRAQVLEREKDQDGKRVKTEIAVGQTGFAKAHFSAVFVLNAQVEPVKADIDLPATFLDIEPERDLYGWLLFQGPSFHRIEKVFSLDSKRAVTASRMRTASTAVDEAMLGDAYFRDSMLQSVQLPVSRDICLPVSIYSVERFGDRSDVDGLLTLVTVVDKKTENSIYSTISAFNQDGKLIERVKGKFHILEHHEEYPTPEEIAEPGDRDETILRSELQRRAKELALAAPELHVAHMPGLHQRTKEERRRLEAPILSQTASLAFLKNGRNPAAAGINWLESGKPVLEGVGEEELGISLSHDESTLVCVAGAGPQGCDLAPITHRQKDDWKALLGNEREPILLQLAANGDGLDTAGMRLFSAAETLRKASGINSVELAVDQQIGDSVLFRSGQSSKGNISRVLTFPVNLTRGPVRMAAVAMGLGEASKAAAAPKDNRPREENDAEYDLAASHRASVERKPDGRQVLAVRFPVTFREAANLSQTLHFSHYFNWIGKLREFIMEPIYEELVELFSSGKWGMVTNSAETRIFGEATSGDVIEGRAWVEKIYGPGDSTTELCFEWKKILPKGGSELIASSTMTSTWVAILGHGVVEVRPMPEFVKNLAKKLFPLGSSDDSPAPENHYPPAGMGRELYCTPPGPAKKSSMSMEQTFETSLEDANLVGNIYFANYYAWQGRARDRFFHDLASKASVDGVRGELRCASCRIEHLQEAMPFDKITVRMYLKAVHERGVRLYFDFFRQTDDGKLQKLGYGEQDAVWFAQIHGGKWAPAELPSTIRDLLSPNLESLPRRSNRVKEEKYDAAIIGAGVGGLSAGALLAKRGYKVLAVEQHDKPGGFCTTWERMVRGNGSNGEKPMRFIFDPGVQDILGLGPKGNIRMLMTELDMEDRIEWRRVAHEYIQSDIRIKVPQNPDDYIDELGRLFPAERNGLAELLSEIEACNRVIYNDASIGSKSFGIKDKSKQAIARWSNTPFTVMLDSYINDQRLKRLLLVLGHYISEDPSAVSALSMCPVFAYYYQGGHYPLGGPQALPNALVDAIEKFGGKVLLRSGASRILIDQGRAQGVQLANGEEIRADRVISNSDVGKTFLELVGREHLPAYFANRIDQLKPSCSAFMVFLGLDFIPEIEPVAAIIDDDGSATHLSVMSKIDPSLAPPGCSRVIVYRLTPHSEAAGWKRGEPGYEDKKRAAGNELIEIAEKAIPGMKDHIVFREEASPKTFARYAGTTGGAIYGTAVDEWRPSLKTPIQGLFMVGAGVAPRPGVEDAVRSAIRTVDAICSEEDSLRRRAVNG